MNTPQKYIAIVSPDLFGPAYGVGHTERAARSDAQDWGFGAGDGIAVDITEAQYLAVKAGNPDAWALEPADA